MTKNLVWALSNLCRGKNPPPDFSKVFYVMFPDAFLVKSIGSCLSIGMRQTVAFGIGMQLRSSVHLMRGTKESVNSSLVQGSSPFICSHYGQRMTLENGVCSFKNVNAVKVTALKVEHIICIQNQMLSDITTVIIIRGKNEGQNSYLKVLQLKTIFMT